MWWVRTRWDKVVNVMGISWNGVLAKMETKYQVQWRNRTIGVLVNEDQMRMCGGTGEWRG